MHSPLAMQDFAHFSDLGRALAEPQDVEHAGHHGLRIGVAETGRPGDRAGGEAGAALGAGVEHHSITSSARPSSEGGTVRPSALAVLRLMISSTFVACWTGRSAGFSPLRIRPV